jgi:phage-related baseplate assembly protein
MARFNLPKIQFADKSPAQIEADIVARYEQLTGKTLAPADPRRIFIKSIVFIIAQQRTMIDYAAKQNLLAYASNEFLDHIGVRTDTDRLQPTYAKTTVRFHLSINQQQTIPAGTRATPGNGIFFAVLQDVPIPGGQSYIDVEAQCTEPGTIGNGYLPGQINQLVDPIQWVDSVENITESEGGAEREDDDSFAERIRISPERFSVAGPTGAYEYWAKTANQLIQDVFVYSPSPGVVEIRPLLQGGIIPGPEILEQIQSVCSDLTVRPLTDFVQTLAPERVEYDVELSYWIAHTDANFISSVQQNVNQAVAEYIEWQKAKLGRDIDPSELIARVKNAGASRVAVSLPVYTQLNGYQVATENQVSVSYGGLTNG